jgi:PAS domain S-box-containing protein
MKKIRLSLSQNVILLLLLPLLLQWALISWLFKLQLDAESELAKSLHANQLANSLVHLRADMYKVIVLAGGEKTSIDGNDDAARAYIGILQRDYADLSNLTRNDNPKLHAAVEESRKEAVTGFSLLLDIKKNMQEAPADAGGRATMWRAVRLHFNNLLKNDFGEISKEQSNLAQRSPLIQKQYRDMQITIMSVLGLLTLAWTILSSIFLKGVTQRIANLSDNAYRLASNRPLNQIMDGSDDIAKLDQTFHEMATTLIEASRKERAVVESARDFICSLDSSLRFTAANPASERILGLLEKDLVGEPLVNFVALPERERVRDFFENLADRADDAENAIEAQLTKAGGDSIFAALSAHWSHDEKSYFVIVHDVTDRHQAEELKQEVVVMVTHDLRTPLATLQNILKLLRSGNFGRLDQKGSEYVMVANRNVERMANLVNDLLDIEKVKSGLMTLNKQPFKLNDSFTAARELAGAFADEARVMIETKQTSLTVNADPDRVTRVLANLIANAVKFSPEAGLVTVAATKEGNWIYTTVDDQGPGIPADQLHLIFERFRQSESAATKGKGGSGLGLTICQAIVELHGGKIWVENLPGGGSRFIFTLPST